MTTHPFVPKPNTSPPLPASVRLIAVGDIMLGRNVEGLMNEHGDDYPLRGSKAFLQSGDLTFGNLEGPILSRHQRTPTGSTRFSFKPEAAEALKRGGLTLVSLANNHTLDYGLAGLAETEGYLKAAGVAYVGHPADVGRASVWRTTVAGVPITWVAFQDVFASLNLSAATKLVAAAAAEDPQALVIVSPHWGDEYKLVANRRQQAFAHALIDRGADLIVGHHPHVVQNIEVYRGKPIFYSLGNFVFDQYFSQETQTGLAASADIATDEIIYRLVPIAIIRSQPMVMPQGEAQAWLRTLAARSDPTLAEQLSTGMITVRR